MVERLEERVAKREGILQELSKRIHEPKIFPTYLDDDGVVQFLNPFDCNFQVSQILEIN